MLLKSCRRGFVHPRSLKANSRNQYLVAIKSFFRFLWRTQRILINPAAELPYAREGKSLPRGILTVSEIERLFQVIPTNTHLGLRDRAIVEVFYSTGMRRNELLGLQPDDVRLDEGLARVVGKGDRERVVPLGKAACRALREYYEKVRIRQRPTASCPVFLSFPSGPIPPHELAQRIHEYARAARLRKKVTPHVFRHTCATHLLQGQADLRTIQAILGHTNLNTTAIYTRVDITTLQAVLRRCHPRETRE